jgi:hypothetical protein
LLPIDNLQYISLGELYDSGEDNKQICGPQGLSGVGKRKWNTEDFSAKEIILYDIVMVDPC